MSGLYFSILKNESISKGFNRLAPFYTFLTRLVFGKQLERAQYHFLNSVNTHDQVLILGGGTGTLLNTLLTLKPTVNVDYIDVSSKMIALARRKINPAATVNFITGTEQNIPDQTYDVVITNFYLDLFPEETLKTVIQKIKPHLKADGQWLVTDFVYNKFWHKVMLWIMYRFFRITTGIEAGKLPAWEIELKQAGLSLKNSKGFFGQFIKSSHYMLR